MQSLYQTQWVTNIFTVRNIISTGNTYRIDIIHNIRITASVWSLFYDVAIKINSYRWRVISVGCLDSSALNHHHHKAVLQPLHADHGYFICLSFLFNRVMKCCITSKFSNGWFHISHRVQQNIGCKKTVKIKEIDELKHKAWL